MTELVQLVAFLIAVGSVLVTAVWTVATVRTTTAVLTERLDQVINSINRLGTKYDAMALAVREIERDQIRLANRLEAIEKAIRS